MEHLAYTELFREAARRHVDLRHTDKEMHFARLVLAGWPFTRLDLQEFLDSTKQKIKLPILLLESYDVSYEQNNADNIRKLCTGAIIILDKPAAADYDARDVTLARCECIGEDVLGYAIEHYRKQRLKLDASTITSEKVGPIENAFWGVRFEFQLPEKANNPLAYQATKFLP